MEFETGDHVVVHPFGHYGTVEIHPVHPNGPSKIVLDKPHDHFADVVWAAHNELQLVRDYEVEQSERAIKELTRDIAEAERMMRYWRDLSYKFRVARADERAERRRAKALPRKTGAIHA